MLLSFRVRIVILLAIVCIIGYFGINYFKPNEYNTLFKDNVYLEGEYEDYISNVDLPLSKVGDAFTYIFNIKFNNIPENITWLTDFKYKRMILNRNGSPSVAYYPKEHILEISVAYKDQNEQMTPFNIDIHNLKIQSWNTIGIVLDNKILSIYNDGYILKKGLLPNVPFIFNKDLIIGHKNNNFNGILESGKYFNRALTPDEILNHYMDSINKF